MDKCQTENSLAHAVIAGPYCAHDCVDACISHHAFQSANAADHGSILSDASLVAVADASGFSAHSHLNIRFMARRPLVESTCTGDSCCSHICSNVACQAEPLRVDVQPLAQPFLRNGG